MVDDRSFSINSKKIKIDLDKDNKTVSVGNMIFENTEDFVYYVNKLTDIAEEMLGEDL